MVKFGSLVSVGVVELKRFEERRGEKKRKEESACYR